MRKNKKVISIANKPKSFLFRQQPITLPFILVRINTEAWYMQILQGVQVLGVFVPNFAPFWRCQITMSTMLLHRICYCYRNKWQKRPQESLSIHNTTTKINRNKSFYLYSINTYWCHTYKHVAKNISKRRNNYRRTAAPYQITRGKTTG